jgi:hypothetical protein
LHSYLCALLCPNEKIIWYIREKINRYKYLKIKDFLMKRNFLTAGLVTVVLALPMQAGIVRGTVIDDASAWLLGGGVVSIV